MTTGAALRAGVWWIVLGTVPLSIAGMLLAQLWPPAALPLVASGILLGMVIAAVGTRFSLRRAEAAQ